MKLDGPMPVVRIRRQLLRHCGQGVLLADLKTAGSRRTLISHNPSSTSCGSTGTVRTPRSKQLASGATQPTWFTSTIGTPLDPEAFGRTVPRICKRAGLGHWSIHELRHSCASLLLAMGVPLEVVSDTLGHASIRVTMDVYGHLLAPSRMHAAEAMRRAL